MSLIAAPERLAQEQVLANTLTLVVTASTPRFVLKDIALCNQDHKDNSVAFAIVPNGEVLADKHYICIDFKLKGKETRSIANIAYVLHNGDKFYLKPTKDCNVYLSGAKFTEVTV